MPTRVSRRDLAAAALALAAAPALAVAKDGLMTDDPTTLRLPAQVVPPPHSLSPQARGFLANAAKRIAANGGQPTGGADQKDEAEAALRSCGRWRRASRARWRPSTCRRAPSSTG